MAIFKENKDEFVKQHIHSLTYVRSNVKIKATRSKILMSSGRACQWNTHSHIKYKGCNWFMSKVTMTDWQTARLTVRPKTINSWQLGKENISFVKNLQTIRLSSFFNKNKYLYSAFTGLLGMFIYKESKRILNYPVCYCSL